MIELHPDVAHLGFLLGTWRGLGAGAYPTIESFGYVEEVVVAHVGKPFLSYGQRTRDATTDAPLHAEQGYLRPVGATGLELVVVQPSGIVEVHTGVVEGSRLSLATVMVVTTPTAKPCTEVRRRIDVDDDVLRYELDMAAVGLPLQHHLRAELHRVEAGG